VTNSRIGGNNNDSGSVVQLSATDGSSLQNIKFTGTDGTRPIVPLTGGADGQLSGTTSNGGSASLTHSDRKRIRD